MSPRKAATRNPAKRHVRKQGAPPAPLKRKKVVVPKDLDPIIEAEKNKPIKGIEEIPEGGSFQIIDSTGQIRSDTNFTDGFVYYTLGFDMAEDLKRMYVAKLRQKGYSRCETGTVENRSMPGAEIWRIPERDFKRLQRVDLSRSGAENDLSDLAEQTSHYDGEVEAGTTVTRTELAATK